ncbi:ArsR/SmtB family transcription factor [Granulosicoccus antarcticus]|uniref:Putative methyltransferase YcgJ n=1 Tax=Granulosicoccus antarcticus IMCC3135 TaxID=1192854 RepID=A0A2Z2NR09_9GAMM|nr:metalloregulator ArsR/SmtB family transcription factor [Granulosicoccus antarcticus]ASJ72431.1 putative methyltransferase YcgJ [Granulosicoccus antarcticus IMCC3135]
MEVLLAGLRAAGEPTRLRLLALCAHGELSVTELTQILSQSQPRVSRHLKLLVEAGLLTRFREGSLVFYRISESGDSAHLARTLVELLPDDDTELTRDLGRLDQIRHKRAEIAENYFQENAGQWNKIRALHVPEADVEQRLLQLVGTGSIGSFLDIGTGTGRVLELFAAQVERGIGLDLSSEMLAIARTQLERDEFRHLQVRKGDMYNMPIDNESIDVATLHLVLHYSLEPALVITEAARTLTTGGRLFIVDFDAHQEERLRAEHKHQRLGFTDREINQCMVQAGLVPGPVESLMGDPLTVKFWQGVRA